MKVTNHDLHIMITKIDGKINTMLNEQEKSVKWQETHEKKDEERFAGLNQYAASIALVASAVGAIGTWVWNKLTDNA